MTRTPEEHLEAIRAAIPARPSTWLPPAEAVGRTLVEPVAAPGDSPAFDNSQMDGYALATNQLAGGVFPVGPTVAAGADPGVLYSDGLTGHIAPVMTGAPVPAGTAAVVPVENCSPPEFVDTEVRVPPVEEGQFVRRAGSDLRAGEQLFAAGHRVNARTVGACALLGVEALPVAEPARVVICTGGEEIGGDGLAQIPDANGPMLAALCARHGIEVAAHVWTGDDPAALEDALGQAVRGHQPTAVITSGGISHGKFEVVRQVLEPAGGWFGHVAQQPGGPQGLAELGGVPVICLPGNPVSTFVSFRVFVAPVLGEVEPPFEAVMWEAVTGLAGRECWVRGGVAIKNGRAVATVTGGKGSHLLAQSVAANVLLRVPAGANLEEGDVVRAYPL